MVDRNYPQRDLFIVPISTLQVGDVVRDFYTKSPSFGVVKRLEKYGAIILWDGEHSFKELKFKGQRGQRGDIIRLRRQGEESEFWRGQEGQGPVPRRSSSRQRRAERTVTLSLAEAAEDQHIVVMGEAAFTYVRNMIDVDAGENAPTTEVHMEVLKAFNIEF